MPAISDQTSPRSLWLDRRGAMFVMGIPMCFFMIGLLYFVIGLGEDLIMRERMQDAADAGALSSAVVYARGMNLIALLNQIMAALVGLLVMVRMLEAVMIAAIAVAGALAWPTAGASLSIVPGAEVAREEAHTAFEELKNVIDPIVRAIHVLEVGVQYAMPALAAARSAELIGAYTPVAAGGIAIPGAIFLPVRNGTWKELCYHAGLAAGELITLPLKPLIPVPPVLNIIKKGIGALTQTFSDTFCGHGGTGGGQGMSLPDELPSVEIPKDDQFNKRLPELATVEECQSKTKSKTMSSPNYEHGPDRLPVQDPTMEANRAAERKDVTEYNDEVCRKAAEEQAMSGMAADGGPRTVSPLRDQPGDQGCQFTYGGEGTQPSACPKDCRGSDNSACDLFMQQVRGANARCKPGAEERIVKYNYQQRELTSVAELTPVPACEGDVEACTFKVKFRPLEYQDVGKSEEHAPCGSKERHALGEGWNSAATYHANGEYADDQYLCSQPHKSVEPSMAQAKDAQTLAEWRKYFGTSDPDSRWVMGNDTAGGQLVVVGSWSAVTYIHSCDQEINNVAQTQKMPPAPSKAGPKESSNCEDSQDEVHLIMKSATPDNILGGGDYQIRSVAFRKMDDSSGRKVVEFIPLRRAQDKEGTNVLGAAGDILRNFFVAQAEYYYDTQYKKRGDDVLDQTDEERKLWTWNMHWKARIRRVRMLSDDDDSTCHGQWKSKGTTLKQDKQKDECQGGDGAAADAVQGADTFGSVFSQITESAGSSLGGTGLPGVGGGKDSSSGSGDTSACGSVSTAREFESLVIH